MNLLYYHQFYSQKLKLFLFVCVYVREKVSCPAVYSSKNKANLKAYTNIVILNIVSLPALVLNGHRFPQIPERFRRTKVQYPGRVVGEHKRHDRVLHQIVV